MAQGRFGASYGHAQKIYSCSDVCNGSCFYSSMSAKQDRTLARCLGPGRRSQATCPEQVFDRLTLLLSSSDMAHDLLHSHLSAGKECLT